MFFWQNALICCTSNVNIQHGSKDHVFKIPYVKFFLNLVSCPSHLEYWYLYTRKNKKGTQNKTRIFFLIDDQSNVWVGGGWGGALNL